MATPPNPQSSTKVIRIQEDEKAMITRNTRCNASDWNTDCSTSLNAAKRIKDPRSNGTDALYVRSSTRGLTQVPEQISLPNLDHEMDDDEDGGGDDDDIEGLNNSVEENHTGMDNDQQQPSSPTMTNGSDEHHEINRIMTDDDDQIQQIRHPSIAAAANHTRRRPVLFTNHKRSISSSTINNSTGDLFSVRAHLQKALHELDRALISRDNHHIDNDDQHRSNLTKTHLLTNGHRHSKLDDIVRTLSTVVNQQQENTRLIIDESSVLLVDDEQKQAKDDQSSVRLSSTTQESIKLVLERLNALVDRGNLIYDRVESILSEL
ncbi:unnamed protein product [Adineta ricciae]|uniref:Uncharacterized protein n=1 Tax=Adineta ricciae TaxID=249248 RepID=A0A814ELZ5_ADIRI|nr:unnamed protein product [Adineta ricciae]